jgi:hypothetical protein
MNYAKRQRSDKEVKNEPWPSAVFDDSEIGNHFLD